MTCYKNIIYGPDFTVDNTGVFTGSATTNVVIPATGKSRLTITPIIGEDNVQVAFYRYTVSFESLIYSANQVLPDMELEIQRIRTILSTPSLKLSIFPVGLGYLPVVNSTALPDLTGGPFPESIQVTPVASNEAIMVAGTIRFDVSHCSPYILRDLVQYNSGVEYAIDEEGNISFIVDTTFQSRVPIVNKTTINTLGAEISRTVGKVFVGFKRKTKTSFSRDQRIARLKTELTEIPSDAAFAPFTKHIDFEDEMGSSLLGEGEYSAKGFYQWNRTMSCTVTLPQRVNKIWAYYVFRQLLIHRLKGVKAHSAKLDLPDVEPTATQTTELATAAKKKSWYLLTHFKIKNPLFSRSISFEAQYLFAMPLQDVLSNKSNIFTTVRHNVAPKLEGDPPAPVIPEEMVLFNPNTTANKDLSEEWDYWNRYEEKSLSGIYNYITSGPIVYAQCAISEGTANILPTKMSISADKDSFNEQEPTAATEASMREVSGLYEEPQKTWIKYENSIEVLQENNNEQITYIQNTPISKYRSDESTSPVSATAGFQINHEVSGTDSLLASSTVVFGTPTNKIRMKGHAVRVGYKIPCPAIVSYNGSPVERIGVSKFSHKVLAIGSVITVDNDPDPDTEIKAPVYLAMWDVTYAINQKLNVTDILEEIKSSGASVVYES